MLNHLNPLNCLNLLNYQVGEKAKNVLIYSIHRLRKKQFQLLGAAAIFLASKLIEPSPVSALTLVKYTADTYDREELLVSLN